MDPYFREAVLTCTLQALARAVYARREIVILDDTFSGLDTSTENHVFHRLCGEQGIFRELNTTVLLVSSSGKAFDSIPSAHRMLTNALTAQRLPFADHIICLDANGKVTGQGAFSDLNNSGGYVASFSLPGADWTYVPNNGGDDDDTTDAHRTGRVLAGSQTSSNEMLVASQTSGSSFTSKGSTVDLEEVSGSNRQAGDLQIYLYYIRSVGWWTSMTFIVAITAFVFCISFPSEYTLLIPQVADIC